MLLVDAEGVRDAAFKHGWNPPVGEIDWTQDDWVLRRLLDELEEAGALVRPTAWLLGNEAAGLSSSAGSGGSQKHR